MKKIIIAEKVLKLIEGRDTIFKRGGIALLTARSAEEIYSLHGVKKADLIIVNYALPLMGAVQLCKEIRGNSLLKKVSIIVIGDREQMREAQCLKAGANAYIPDPNDPALLFSTVSELFLVPHRTDIRVPMRITIQGMEGNAAFRGVSQNLSISGMLLETDHAITKGERLTCTFSIANREIVAQCQVMREGKSLSGRHQYGIKFVNLDTKSLIIIEHFVSVKSPA